LAWWCCLCRPHTPPLERVEVTEETKLVELCDEEYAERGEFERSLAECFKGMSVKHLKGKDEAGWEAFVKGEGGPHGLVSGWLEENQLWRFLRGYLSPTITKKAKDGDSRSSSSASPGKRTCLVLTFGLTFRRSFSSQEPLWQARGDNVSGWRSRLLEEHAE
jgi:hypothetical protein